MNDPHEIETVMLDSPEFIDSVGELSIGDQVVFSRRSLSVEEIESKLPQRVIAGFTQTVEGTNSDPEFGIEPFEIKQHAVKVEGDWSNGKLTVLADAFNRLNGDKEGIVEYDSGIRVEVAVVSRRSEDADLTKE